LLKKQAGPAPLAIQVRTLLIATALVAAVLGLIVGRR